jgi:alanyl-tRNA synthetase
VTAGMHPLVPYLMGEKHPLGKRIVNIQKCVRTGDIDDVGDSSHNTFFEMLGNWSFGDYFKNESIQWSWEFLTDKKWLGINPEKIKVTVFEGDDDAPRDGESIEIWKKCFQKSGLSAEVYKKEKKNNESAKIFPLPKKDNWWGPAGKTGPCGPDTEIFVDLGKSINFEKCPNGDNCKPGCNCGRYVEIWNNVFMEYNKTSDGKYVPLKQKNVDTGMGMERILAILNGFDNVYETDLLAPIIDKVEKLSGKKCNESESIKKSIRIIADHIRTSAFMILDGVEPSNLDRGYVLRKLLRRAIRHGNLLKMPDEFLLLLAETVIEIYKEFYLEMEKNKAKILNEIKKEEDKFFLLLIKCEPRKNKRIEILKRTMRGVKEMGDKKVIENDSKIANSKAIDKWLEWSGDLSKNPSLDIAASFMFALESTYGYPHDLFLDDLRFESLMGYYEKSDQLFSSFYQKHRKLSQTAAAGKFKGGLADTKEETKKLHTVAHLLLESLRRVLGDHIFQKGSNINSERLRFDFSHPEKLTDEEKQEVEDLVNEQIQKNLPVNFKEMKLEDAKKIGAMGVFDAKYSEKVKVYTIGKNNDIFSKEICAGPHINHTGELGTFKIQKEKSSSAGVRRIKAILE